MNSAYIKARLKQILPESFIGLNRSIRSVGWYQKLKSDTKLKKLKKNKVLGGDIIAGLASVGLTSGMNIMVHSSLSGIGFIEGGANTVIEVVTGMIGDNGLISMPCPPVTGATIEALRAGSLFEPDITPCVTGVICETFRKKAGVVRSCHPTHSVVAKGSRAEWFVKDHHLDLTPFGKRSPFAKLLELDGYILGIGLDTRWITFYHHFEDDYQKFPVDVYSEERFSIPVRMGDGRTTVVTTPSHDSRVSTMRLNNDSQTLTAIDNALTEHSGIKRGVIGVGSCYLVKASRILETLKYIWEKDGQTIYNLSMLRDLNPELFNK
jgi:aminoglycoside 3-N-acetyltransferase